MTAPETPAEAGNTSAQTSEGLGTFLGVFTPTVLTILGVIMFLRLGWVVGEVGIHATLLIVGLAHVITLITTLSFSSVATNKQVGVGGAYYIISRSLGLEIGGAIGLPLFLSQALSVTLYAFGLAESLRMVAPGIDVQVAAVVIILAVGALAFKGAGIALKIQLPLMVMIAVAMLALVAGVMFGEQVTVETTEAVTEGTEGTVGFWVVFAVFFPAVTGIMAGLGLSGDLKNSARSLPRGSLAAVLTGLVVYTGLPFLLEAGASAEALREDQLIWTRIAPLGAWLILPGLWGAIFSSAVGSILGAPRTLQALSMDHLAPKLLARVTGKTKEPIFGLVATVLIALAAVALGDLNAVAGVVSMFFLTVYGGINLVAALETLASDPSWRPKIRMPWPIPLFGAFACAGVMFLINPLAAIVAIAVETLLWMALRRRERKAGFGDARRGMYEALIRWSLVRLAQRPPNARNWRPHILVFAHKVEERLNLVHLGSWFSQDRGVVTVCELMEGSLTDPSLDPVGRRAHISRVLDEARLQVFPEVDVVPELVSGMASIAQANGIAGLDSNTVVIGWPDRTERLADFLRLMRVIERFNKSVLIARIRDDYTRPYARRQTIHIWWGGMQRNGDLMLLLAHLLTRNAYWRGARIHLLSITPTDEDVSESQSALKQLIAETRIPAEAVVIRRPEGASIADVIRDRSRKADLVFMGLNMPGEGEAHAYAERLEGLAKDLPTVVFVKNSSLFEGELL